MKNLKREKIIHCRGIQNERNMQNFMQIYTLVLRKITAPTESPEKLTVNSNMASNDNRVAETRTYDVIASPYKYWKKKIKKSMRICIIQKKNRTIKINRSNGFILLMCSTNSARDSIEFHLSFIMSFVRLSPARITNCTIALQLILWILMNV